MRSKSPSNVSGNVSVNESANVEAVVVVEMLVVQAAMAIAIETSVVIVIEIVVALEAALHAAVTLFQTYLLGIPALSHEAANCTIDTQDLQREIPLCISLHSFLKAGAKNADQV